MGNKSSSPSSQIPPNFLGSGSGSKSIPKHGTHYYTAPFITQPYGIPDFHQSLNSLQHFSGTDSGHMTSPANSERWRTSNWKIGSSCLSLNEAFFMDGPPGAPSTMVPMPTIISIPPLTLKQYKKWQKRQKKVLKKMNSIPANIISPHASVTPLLQYSRAFSVDNLSRQVVDGYVNVPVTRKRNQNECGKVKRNQTYSEAASDMPPGPLKSAFNSSCSDGLAVSDLRMMHSAPSMNISDRSHLTSTTDHSSAVHHQTPSPIQVKNLSNQHFQRIRISRNDAGLAGTPKRLQQRNFLAKGGPSDIVQHDDACVIDEITNSEVRKSEITHYSAHINYESRKNATNIDCNHSKAATSHDYDERNYGYRNDISTSNRNNQYIDCIANNNDDISTEHNIPVKIILEAEKIPEKNNNLFSKNVTDPINDDKVFLTDETASNPSKQYNSTSGTATPNQITQQTQSADYGSTISSLTQSSNMKTEVSDIDFSWVNDVENRLEREIAYVKEDSGYQLQRKQLPARYFGMDLDQSKIDNEAMMVTSPMYTTTKSLEVFGECESRKELSQIQSDVRSKAAVFDIEAFRNERKVDEQQAAYRYRSRSTPRNNLYIPQPDYRSYDPVSIDNLEKSGRYDNIHSNDVSVATGAKFDRCPQRYGKCKSNLKLNGNAAEIGIKCDDSYHSINSEKIIKQQQKRQHQPYSDYGNEIMQRNRTYDATKYYIQNAARHNTEKSWKISVAY